MNSLRKKQVLLQEISENLLNDTSAPLYEYRVENSFHTVMGEGSPNASIMIIGEAPGLTEAKSGRPFCGASGKVLDALLAHVGLDRASVYITSIVKDRPPKNRDPLPAEIAYYGSLLIKQIEIIKPTKIVTLGRFSMDYIMKLAGLADSIEPISKMHGKSFEGEIGKVKLTVVTLYHPAVALYNGSMRAILMKDAEVIR